MDFIQELDKKKEQTFDLTFSMISENYTYFYKIFTGKQSTMILKKDSIELLIENRPVDISSMSGGQKSVVALSIIFAIQRNDPSPFYVFDEIDANLDSNHCEKLASIISESDAQYFIGSFKAEMIEACDSYFGVVSKDKQSFIDTIDKQLAYETIKP